MGQADGTASVNGPMMALFKEIKKYYVYDEIRKGKSNYTYGYRNKWEGRHVINFRFYSQAYQSH